MLHRERSHTCSAASYRVFPDIPAQACLETRPFPGTDLNLSAMQAPGILSNIQLHPNENL